MEATLKKFQRKFRKIREEMERWEDLQSYFLSYFRNACAIIDRLQVIRDSNNYGMLNSVEGIQDSMLRKQVESLESLLHSIKKTLDEFHGVVLFIEKMQHDGRQLVGGGSFSRLTVKQLHQHIGIKPCFADCLDGLVFLHDMHSAEYHLKLTVVSALSALALKPSSADLGALQQLLIDQPNIPKDDGMQLIDKYMQQKGIIC